MTYQLVNNSTSSGDSGGMSTLTKLDENENVVYKYDAEPEVGWCIRVGSTYARTMQVQDWWQTSYITEIISRTETPEITKVLFRTFSGSTYTWSNF